MSIADIHAIYLATEGEGINLGIPQVFVRFQGCSIGCVNCDSMETWEFDSGRPMLFSQVIDEISRVGQNGLIKRVSFTGGDPLHPKHRVALTTLIDKLKAKGYWINIEAAGTVIVDEVFDKLDFISFDIKTPSTGVRFNPRLLNKMMDQYSDKFQLKAVVDNRQDFDFISKLYDQFSSKNVNWCITPGFMKGETLPKEKILQIMDWNIADGGKFRVICQQHKFLFGADRTNV
jgi:7-carboxy-7-deazaguanine synthase